MGEITKYEYSIDNGSYVEGESTYTFTGLTQNTNHTIKVRVTNTEGLTTESEEKAVQTSILNKPTFSEVETDSGKTVTITYPEGNGLTYQYQKDSGSWEIATQVQQVEFTESGTLVARVSDGTNEETATYSVEIASAGSDLVEMAGVVETGDGLYKDAYEENVYTYRGANPNNYVTFNGEQWRIISINISDNTIKILHNGFSNRAFDTNNGRYQGSNEYCNSITNGCNIWGSSSTLYDVNLSPITELAREVNGAKYKLPSQEADLNEYLNGTYYNGLNETARGMIKEDAVYKAGVLKLQSNQTISTDMQQVSAAKWKGKIGLIDATEYVRASINSSCVSINTGTWTGGNNCMANNWLYISSPYWTMTPYSSGGSSKVLFIASSGNIDENEADMYATFVRPVVTLSPEVKITGGDGSSTNSYQLSL